MIRFLSCLLAVTIVASSATAATITYDIGGYFTNYNKKGPYVNEMEQYTDVYGPTTFSTRLVFDVNSPDSAPIAEFGYYYPVYFELLVNNKIVSSSNNGNSAVASVSNGFLDIWDLQFSIWNDPVDLSPLIPGIESNSFNMTIKFHNDSLNSDRLGNFDISDVRQIYSSYLFDSSVYDGGLYSYYSLRSNYDPGSLSNNVNFITDYRVTIQSAVPEPSTWFSMIIGFGILGIAMRKKSQLKFV